MNSVAHPACGNAKHPAQLSTAQKADRRARRYIRFHAFQSEEKQDARQTQEFKNSRIQGVQEANTDERANKYWVEHIAHRMEAGESPAIRPPHSATPELLTSEF
jgi:hypothetical protein